MKITLQNGYEEFILSRRLADLSPKTIKDYQQFLHPFLESVGLDKGVEEITQGDITKYVAMLLDKPISKATRATYIRHLKVLLKWLSDNYSVAYNYKRVKVPKSPKKCVKIYSDEELTEIFKHIHCESEWLTVRNRCIIALMYDSGLRQSEVCTLERSRISFKEKRMVVHGKGNKERTVPLGGLTARLMREYLDICPYKSNMLFVTRRGDPLTCNAVKLLVSKLSHSLTFELSSHKLRHNCATNYCIDQYEVRGHVDIYRLMILMGHEDIETTKRYLHHANEIVGARDSISHLDKVYCLEN